MKKAIKSGLLLTIVIAALSNPLKAQDTTKELAAFTKKFEQAYNKKDDKALKEMFTSYAVRTAQDGTIINGNEAIRASLAEYLKDSTTIEIQQDKVVAGADGSAIATGTFHVTGTSKTGEKVDVSGGYNNTVVKEKGQWKISKQVLLAL